jgi:hypothetical protein
MDALGRSGPEYVAEVQLAMPDVSSLPCHLIVRGAVYQPVAAAFRSGVTAVTCGAVLSTLIERSTLVHWWLPFST